MQTFGNFLRFLPFTMLISLLPISVVLVLIAISFGLPILAYRQQMKTVWKKCDFLIGDEYLLLPFDNRVFIQPVQIDPYKILRQPTVRRRKQNQGFTMLERRLGLVIHPMLRRLAEAKWPKVKLWWYIPIRTYRIRKQQAEKSVIWWVERDIPPYDLYRCAAYLVELTMDQPQHPILKIHTRTHTFTVPDPGRSNLETILSQAGRDPAMIIPRRMGQASD
jgi:hypothetical protein